MTGEAHGIGGSIRVGETMAQRTAGAQHPCLFAARRLAQFGPRFIAT
jgi:hypothetical protein